MSEPKIIVPDISGYHNKDLDRTINRLKKAGTYKDQSTILLCPTRGVIPATVVQSWMGIIRPMNQPVVGPIFIQGMEVGEAYEQAINLMFSNFPTFKYLLTLEEDNTPPPDGLLKLLESIEGEVDGEKYDIMAGLYYTKGEGGMPMIYGDPNQPTTYNPQIPITDAIQPCNATGMGFTLFRMEMFKDERWKRPFFKTLQRYEPNGGSAVQTQDIYMMSQAKSLGYKIASDNRVRVGHYEINSGITW